jgi:hypothetical protein
LTGNKQTIDNGVQQAKFANLAAGHREVPGRPPGSLEEKPRNLKNRACKVVGASLGSILFLGKPFKAVARMWPPPQKAMIYGS